MNIFFITQYYYILFIFSPYRAQLEEVLEEDGRSTTTSHAKYMADQLVIFQPLYDSIKLFGSHMAFAGKVGKPVPGLEVSISVSDTWYEQPMSENSSDPNESDEFSDWELQKDFMPCVTNRGCLGLVPSDLTTTPRRNMFPWGIPVRFDKEVEQFLSGPLLVKDSKVRIEAPYAVGPGLLPVTVNKSIVQSEKFCRTGLKDSFTVEFMLDLLVKRLGEVLKAKTWDYHQETFLTLNWLKLIQVSAFRSSSFLTGTQIILKGAIRDEALSKLYGQPSAEETKTHLRYSHWASPNLFGPLPSAFAGYLLPTSHAQAKYLLYAQPAPSSSKGQQALSSSSKKRSASSSWPKASKKAKVVTPTQLVTPAEVLNLSKSKKANNFRNTQNQGGSKGSRKKKNEKGK